MITREQLKTLTVDIQTYDALKWQFNYLEKTRTDNKGEVRIEVEPNYTSGISAATFKIKKSVLVKMIDSELKDMRAALELAGIDLDG